MLALFLVGAGLAELPVSDTRGVASIVAEINVPREARVGSLSAGLFCAPRGSLYREDFVASASELKDIVASALQTNSDDLRDSASPTFGLTKIAVRGLDARLCAKKYGLWGTGDQSSLSGRVSVLFDVDRLVDGRLLSSAKTISLEVESRNARTARQIFSESVSQLINDLRQNSRVQPR